jgi:hypothetical protein
MFGPNYADDHDDPFQPADPLDLSVPQYDEPVNCLCGGLMFPLGSLGRLDWYRCRACGIDSSITRSA